MARHTIDLSAAKSRSDDTLLTVGFNLRLRSANPTTLSPAWDDTILMTWGEVYATLLLPVGYATASPTVNKMLSHAGHSFTNTILMCYYWAKLVRHITNDNAFAKFLVSKNP